MNAAHLLWGVGTTGVKMEHVAEPVRITDSSQDAEPHPLEMKAGASLPHSYSQEHRAHQMFSSAWVLASSSCKVLLLFPLIIRNKSPKRKKKSFSFFFPLCLHSEQHGWGVPVEGCCHQSSWRGTSRKQRENEGGKGGEEEEEESGAMW